MILEDDEDELAELEAVAAPPVRKRRVRDAHRRAVELAKGAKDAQGLRQPKPTARASADGGSSWWIGKSRDELRKDADEKAYGMSRSTEGRRHRPPTLNE